MKDLNPHDQESVKEKQKQVQLKRLQDKDDLKWILSDPKGRRFIWKYLSFCGVFRTSFTGNSQTFFKEGERNIGLRLFDEVFEADEDAFLKMKKESKGELNDN